MKVWTCADDPDAVEAMLRHMYGFDYADHISEDSRGPLLHVKVYKLADFHHVPLLIEEAEKNFQESLQTGWSTDAYPDFIHTFYSFSTNAITALRTPLLDICVELIEDLLRNERFAEILEVVPEFSHDLMNAMTARNRELGDEVIQLEDKLKKWEEWHGCECCGGG